MTIHVPAIMAAHFDSVSSINTVYQKVCFLSLIFAVEI